jgi:hypothetical protein
MEKRGSLENRNIQPHPSFSYAQTNKLKVLNNKFVISTHFAICVYLKIETFDKFRQSPEPKVKQRRQPMMKILHKPASLSLTLLSSGFQTFKRRISQELMLRKGVNLEDYTDDEGLYAFYLRGEPENYVMDALCGCAVDEY